MEFNRDRVLLRRYELHMYHHSAYLFWNLRGLLSEKWGHGPHFGATANAEDQVTLTPVRAGGGPKTPVGVYGLKGSLLMWETPPSAKQAQALALEWLNDCIEALSPRRVVRIFARLMYAYPLSERDLERVSGALYKEYPISHFAPEGYQQVYGAANFQARSKVKGTDTLTTGVFGIYGPDQAKTYYQDPVPDDDKFSLGFFYDIQERNEEHGLRDPRKALPALASRAQRESYDLLTRTMMRLIADA